MKIKRIMIFILILATAKFAFAGRYYIPKDKDVITQINSDVLRDLSFKKNINILVWNIYKGKIVDWENDFLSLAKSSDLLILQESFLNPKMKRTFRNINDFQIVMATAWEDTKYSNTKSGVATASRVAPINSLWQRSFFMEPITRTPKMTLFSEYAIENSKKNLLVGNIHGINFVTAAKLKHMIDQAVVIIRNHSGPVVFAGDFNTWTKKKLRVMRESLESIGLKAVTFSPDERKRALGKPLDHIWTKGLLVTNSKVLKTITTSDHKPMMISVELPE